VATLISQGDNYGLRRRCDRQKQRELREKQRELRERWERCFSQRVLPGAKAESPAPEMKEVLDAAQ